MLEELTQGKLLQAQVVGRAEDGVPYINVFQIQPNSAVSHQESIIIFMTIALMRIAKIGR